MNLIIHEDEDENSYGNTDHYYGDNKVKNNKENYRVTDQNPAQAATEEMRRAHDAIRVAEEKVTTMGVKMEEEARRLQVRGGKQEDS